ncbi:Ubiquitin family protein, partial [Globisporangium splendens]
MVTLHVKTTAGKKFSVDIELESTVAQCKQALVEPTEVPEAQQRLIYKGKVLKDDQTLASYGIEADHTIFFVRGSAPRPARPAPTTEASTASETPAPAASATPAAAPTPAAAANPFGFPLFPPMGGAAAGASNGAAANPFGGLFGAGAGMPNMAAMQQQLMQNPDMMRQMMESPMMQGILNNPEIMRTMMQSNPQIQQLMEQNPQLSHVLNDPELLRQSMEAMRNPAAMREMMRSQDTAMRNIESHPEGFNALRRMYHDVQEPLLDAAASGANAPRGPAFTMPGVAGGNANATTTQPASTTNSTASATTTPANPWATPSTSQNTSAAANPWAGLGGLGGMNAGAMGGAPNPEMMTQILQNPLFQPVLEQIANNPELFLSQMEQMNPQMSQMLNANPQVRQMMQNPDFLRAMMNPQNMQAMMQMQSAMNQLRQSGLVPGLEGMNLGGAAAGGNAPGANTDATANPFAAFGGFGGFPLGGGAAPAGNPEELYASQLTQLVDMGFSNREQNIRALQATQGNVHAAVDRLLSGTI